MSNKLGSIKSLLKNGKKHIIIESETIELSGNTSIEGNIISESINTSTLTFGGYGTQSTLPSDRGTSGQVLKTDGNGSLSWQAESSEAGTVIQ